MGGGGDLTNPDIPKNKNVFVGKIQVVIMYQKYLGHPNKYCFLSKGWPE